ncbi:MAG: hypothetical protein ABWZ82_04365 [Candidatus Limnocylindrales bacterium]
MDERAVPTHALEGQLVPASGAMTPEEAATVMGELGFLVVPGAPGRDSTAYLLLAIRQRPTLAHFDPESVLYWTHLGIHDGPAAFDGSVPLPVDTPFSWGAIRVSDRLGVANEYLTFGGRLCGRSVDGTRIAVFATPGPMIRRGGHSQGWDPGAAHLAAWFGRLRACLGRDVRLDARVTAMTPLARYSAYLAGAISGFAEAPALSADRHAELSHLRSEAERLHRDHHLDWTAGVGIVAALDTR